MPVTNEHLSAQLIGNLLANGYTPRTPEEWIMSALNYLDQEATAPPLGGGGTGILADGSVTGATGFQQPFTKGINTNDQNGVQINPFGAAAGNTGEVRFKELAANGVNYVGFKASDSLAGNVIWTLPTTDSTGTQALVSSGAGILSWATVAIGTFLKTDGSVAGSTVAAQSFGALGIKTNNIVASGALADLTLTLPANSSGAININTDTVGQGTVSIRGYGGVQIGNGAVAGSTIDIQATGAGSTITATTDAGVVTLTVVSGFTQSTVSSPQKGGLTGASSLGDLLKWAQGIENVLFTNIGFVKV